jgi:hypothetical protein
MHPRLNVLASAIALFLLANCGGSGSAVRPTSAFTDQDTRLFEDGLDLVGDPDGLTGRWADDWSNEMRDRVERSDFVALVTVNTLRTDIDPEQQTTHWLLVGIDDVLKGRDKAREISLASPQAAIGFQSVDRERATILRKPLVLLAKWVAQPNGGVRPAWHLAPASREVVAAVRSHLQIEAPPPSTIVETHESDSKTLRR